MIEIEDLVAFAGPPMGRHDRRAVEDLDGLCCDANVESSTDVTSRDRVMALTDTHSRFRIHTMRSEDRHVERFSRQAREHGGFAREVLTDADTPMSDEPTVVEAHRRGEELVELCHRRDTRDGDEVTAPESSDLALHAAFLVRAADARDAEEAVEAVMCPGSGVGLVALGVFLGAPVTSLRLE